MGGLSEGLTQLLISAAALLGIGFALLQWLLVSRVKISGYSDMDESQENNLIEGGEEEGIDDFEVVAKCAEIQKAISVGELFNFLLFLSFSSKINFDNHLIRISILNF